ncbi:DNA repair and recombination protein RadB [Candidatus Woesearchaeota archaeon]|nr:DNA repair and recombination protein RadB [Candidatus Woesearchaeota archaeon]
MEEKVSSGCAVVDALLDGGYERGVITTVYGPAGAGKTTLTIMAAIACARQGKKVLFIDTEGGFSVERLRQLAQDYEEVLSHIIFLKPTTFEEQKQVFDKIKSMISDRFALIVMDTISMLYRTEFGRNKDIQDINRILGVQISLLTEIARKHAIPVLLTNQVYADFEQQGNVKMVGGDILKYSSKCLLEIEKFRTKRKLRIVKHRSLPENKDILFEIQSEGFVAVS